MIPMTLEQIATITRGMVHGTDDPASIVITADVVTDSREAQAGSLYVARIGEALDGHDFVAGARDRGAVAALTTRSVDDLPCVVVEDDQAAFAALARHLIDSRPDLLVVGITGSSGKTSTKDLLGSVLALKGPTIAPVGSLNSEVGVPLTVCRITPETEHLVVEMGARGIGHIRYLTEMAPPQIGVELNVGTAHVGEFGSREAIAKAKAELVEALPDNGIAVLNADDPAVRAMAARTRARVVLVGEALDADVRADSVTIDDHGRASFDLVTPVGSTGVTLALVGRHHVANALAVVAVALEAGLTLDQIHQGLEQARPISRWRMEVTERADSVTVVNDAYNANPDSMRAALTSLRDMGAGRRTWAVLGSMLELGPDSDVKHAGVGAFAAEHGVNELVVVGEVATPMAEGARMTQRHGIHIRQVADAEAAEAILRAELRPGDVVLFKSSRDAGLRWLGDRVSADGVEGVD
jgi:UDP-N-acetylmuramoyl-tripeptide--D-alanyl-D-alanine ligase